MRVKKAKRRPGPQPFYPGEPANAAPKGAQLRAKLDADKGFMKNHAIPAAVADEMAERKLTGGYKVAKGNISKCCFVARANNGACGGCGGRK